MPLTTEQQLRLEALIAVRDSRAGRLPPQYRVGPGPAAEPSKRELEVLRLLADGLTNAQIAGRLIIDVETVKSHVRHLIGKLEARNRTHAAVLGLRRGLID